MQDSQIQSEIHSLLHVNHTFYIKVLYITLKCADFDYNLRRGSACYKLEHSHVSFQVIVQVIYFIAFLTVFLAFYQLEFMTVFIRLEAIFDNP